MKKFSIQFASAAVTLSALPWCGGCGTQQAAEQPDAGGQQSSAVQPAAQPLKPVAVPPTLRTISFEGDLFAPPPAPMLSHENAAAALQLAEEADRQGAEPEVVVAEEYVPAAEPLDTAWPGPREAVGRNDDGQLPPLEFRSYDPEDLNGTAFDYAGGHQAEAEADRPTNAALPSPQSTVAAEQPPAEQLPLPLPVGGPREANGTEFDYAGTKKQAPVIAQPVETDPYRKPPAAAEEFTLAPPANAAREPEIPRGSAWRGPAPAAEALERPAFGEDHDSQQFNPEFAGSHLPPVAKPEPMPSGAPSDLSVPSLVDTREWSHRQPTPPQSPSPEPLAAPYAGPLAEPAAPLHPPMTAPPQVTAEPLELPLASHRGDMQVARHHAQMLIDRGKEIGERGALYSAKDDFKHALRLVAEAQDAISGDRRHSEALARGWQALREAADFSPDGAETVDLAQVVSAHRTKVLNEQELSTITPLEATQRYFAYAQEQLALAGGDEPVAAEAMHLLGKTHGFIARESSKAARKHGPRALAMQQAALMVDDRHDGAANELGVLLAKYGQWNDARRVLLHAVNLRPTVEKWQNLAVVHDKLGEVELAGMARQEAELAARQQGVNAIGPSDNRVEWVSPDAFARSGASSQAVHRTAPPPEPTPQPKQESGTAWMLPWFK